MRTSQLLLSGIWQDGGNGTIEVRSPFDGRQVASVSRADRGQIEAAAAGAVSARTEVEALTHEHRAAILERARAAVQTRRDELVRLLVEEAGKPVTRREPGQSLEVTAGCLEVPLLKFEFTGQAQDFRSP